jgi:hypothetical protein
MGVQNVIVTKRENKRILIVMDVCFTNISLKIIKNKIPGHNIHQIIFAAAKMINFLTMKTKNSRLLKEKVKISNIKMRNSNL